MSTKNTQEVRNATAAVLSAAGFAALAVQVTEGTASPQAGVYMALRSGLCGHHRERLSHAQELVGMPKLDTRHFVETGKRRIQTR
jgi:hypothetical protein